MKCILVTGVVAFSALPLCANATVTPSLSSESYVAFDNSSSNAQDGNAACFQFSGSGGTVGCVGTATTPTTGTTLNYSTTATAGYGVLKAGGTSSISGASGPANTTDYSTSYGQASFEDSWTITGGTGQGTLDLQFSLDGSYDFHQVGTGVVSGFSLTNLDNYPASSSGTPSFPNGGPGTISNTVNLITTFTFGTPLDFLVNLLAGSNLYDLGDDVSSTLDLSDTAQMTAIIVEDANGDIIPFSLSTASGASLFSQLAVGGAPSTSVPEPASLALVGAGLTALGWVRRARVRRKP